MLTTVFSIDFRNKTLSSLKINDMTCSWCIPEAKFYKTFPTIFGNFVWIYPISSMNTLGCFCNIHCFFLFWGLFVFLNWQSIWCILVSVDMSSFRRFRLVSKSGQSYTGDINNAYKTVWTRTRACIFIN